MIAVEYLSYYNTKPILKLKELTKILKRTVRHIIWVLTLDTANCYSLY